MTGATNRAFAPVEAAPDRPALSLHVDDRHVTQLQGEIDALGTQIAEQADHLHSSDRAGWLEFSRLNLRQSELRTEMARLDLARADSSRNHQRKQSSRQVLLFTAMVRDSNRQIVARYEAQLGRH